MEEVVRENEVRSGSLLGFKQRDPFLKKQLIVIEMDSAFLGRRAFLQGPFIRISESHDLIHEQ